MRAEQRVVITRSVLASATLWLTFLQAASPVFAQQAEREAQPQCGGSQAQPSQSALWPVAFCNRTPHDLVIEFHDNDCPAQSWARRGDIYRRGIRHGDSLLVPLCYAVGSQETRTPAPGVPQLRIPGGKGVVTTWTVVGDCGDRSDHLNRDALTFYDRGDFKSGIILLQSPPGAPHCVADASSASRSAASPSAPAATPATSATPSSASRPPPTAAPPTAPSTSPSATSAQSQTPPSAAHQSASVPPAVPDQPAQSAVAMPQSSAAPSLSASIDPHDSFNLTVHVYATSDAGAGNQKCTFLLALSFTDGGSWNDRTHANVPPGANGSQVLTRKYGKSVAKVTLSSPKCAPL